MFFLEDSGIIIISDAVYLCKWFLRNVSNHLHNDAVSQPRTPPSPPQPPITPILKPQSSHFYPPFSSRQILKQEHLRQWSQFVLWLRFLFLYGSTFFISFWNAADGLISVRKSCWYFVPIYRTFLPLICSDLSSGLDLLVAR